MFCPNCGTENLKEAKFCRKCGANLALVPQALSGELPRQRMSKHERREARRRAERNRPPSLEHGVRHSIMGLGFLIVSIAIFFSPGGKGWFWAFLFPAFSLIAKGVSEILAAQKQQQNQIQQPSTNQVAIPPPPQSVDYSAPKTGELQQPPPSVTEGTTRFFDPPPNRANE